jgi:beta-lactamase regulating signal transducer with metallopeptidase domain
MENVFLKLLNMSIAAGWLVLAVTALRFLLKKAPKALRCVLWALVGIRLICPFSFESALSLIPSAETVPEEMFVMEPPENRQSAVIDVEVNPLLPGDYTPELDATVDRLQIGHMFGTLLWLPGVAVMLLYAAVSFLRLRRRVKVSLNVRENLWICDDIKTPFILGILKPRVYLPSHMDARHLAHVVAHENAHIRRRDHWWKSIGFFLLAVYWFNPLIWLAYILLCRDIELACDERVVKEMGSIERKAYSEALLSFSVPQRMVTACPLAFGEVGVKERIRNVLSYKKPAFWIIVAAAAACVVLAVCFLTNPKEGQDLSFLNYENLVTLAAQADTLPVHVSIQSDAVDDTVDGNNLAAFLDNASWMPQRGILRTIQRETDQNSTASIQIQFNDTVWMTIFDTDTAYIYSNGRGRYYRTQDGDYEKALALIDSSSSSDVVSVGSILTLHDVLELSQKGNALSWEDFDSYSYLETGSGLYIRVYEINSLFSLWIGGGLTTEKPMYIYLKTNTAADDYIDIRTEDVSAFIGMHKEALLDLAVSNAILEHNKRSDSTGDFACESHVILGTAAGASPPATQVDTVIVYAMVLYQEYTFSDRGIIKNASGGHIPAALTFDKSKDGSYTLTEYWEPRDGAYYGPDIKAKFPESIWQDAFDTQKYILAQIQNCYAQAVEYGKVDTDAVIAGLLATICASPAESSAPSAYIDAHPIDYRELTYYGDYTLRYVFTEFLKGGQTGLNGHIMRIVMDDLIGGEVLGLQAETGQAYFDEWLATARQNREQYGDDYMKQSLPKAWMLLQMAEA